MVIGLAYALLATLCGVAVQRGLRQSWSSAPLSGLAIIAVLTSWTTALHLPPLAGSSALVLLALAGLACAARALPSLMRNARACRAPAVLLVAATFTPALLLGTAFAAVEAPVSVHDGAFHVETIDRLRQGLTVENWYPLGFHTSLAALLGLVPWLDSARGTAEAAQGLAILAPLGVWALGLALGADALIAAVAAVILALTWTYPYDYHLWGGWPQGMGVLLLLGLWSAALHWIARPSMARAVLGALFASAIVLSHGTEVYSAVLGLAIIALARRRVIDPGRLLRQVPLALALAVVMVGPYLFTLLGWAGGGAATGAGSAVVDYAAAHPDAIGPADWLQYVLGATGAAAPLDLPLRMALISLGLTLRPLRLGAWLWLTFIALLTIVDFVDLAPVRAIFVVTYPWLADHRPRQIAVVSASLLAAGGLTVGLSYLVQLRRRLVGHPNAWRRIAVAAALVLAFFTEGSAVSVYKRVAQTIDEQNVFSADDDAAMVWLRQHAQAGEMLANDGSKDAGIWAPYKATIPILLPRSGTRDTADRIPIVEHITDLNAVPAARAKRCALHVDYLYVGARPLNWDEPLLPDRASLERATDLEEVFASGDAAIFRITSPCN